MDDLLKNYAETVPVNLLKHGSFILNNKQNETSDKIDIILLMLLFYLHHSMNMLEKYLVRKTTYTHTGMSF